MRSGAGLLSSLMSGPEASGDEKRRTSSHPLDSSPTVDRLGEKGQDVGWLNGRMAERKRVEMIHVWERRHRIRSSV